MAKGYWIGRVDVHNDEGYKPYAAANAAIFRKYGGRFVVRAGKFECVEGTSRSRNVVIEFPDYAAALACYSRPNTRPTSRCASRTPASISSSSKATTARSRNCAHCPLAGELKAAPCCCSRTAPLYPAASGDEPRRAQWLLQIPTCGW